MPARRIAKLAVWSAASVALLAGPAWAFTADKNVDVNALAKTPPPAAPLLPPAVQHPRPSRKMQPQTVPPAGGPAANQPMTLKVRPTEPPKSFEGKYILKGATHQYDLGHLPEPGKSYPPDPGKSFPPDPITDPMPGKSYPPDPFKGGPKAASGEALGEAIKSTETEQEAARNKSQQSQRQFQNTEDRADQQAEQLSTIMKTTHDVKSIGGSASGLGE